MSQKRPVPILPPHRPRLPRLAPDRRPRPRWQLVGLTRRLPTILARPPSPDGAGAQDRFHPIPVWFGRRRGGTRGAGVRGHRGEAQVAQRCLRRRRRRRHGPVPQDWRDFGQLELRGGRLYARRRCVPPVHTCAKTATDDARTGCGVNTANPRPTTSINELIALHNYRTGSSLAPFRQEGLLALILAQFGRMWDPFLEQGFEAFTDSYLERWIHSYVPSFSGRSRSC